jgi:hypothetical protein
MLPNPTWVAQKTAFGRFFYANPEDLFHTWFSFENTPDIP